MSPSAISPASHASASPSAPDLAKRPEIAALISLKLAELRARHMNLIEKRDHDSALLRGISFDKPARRVGQTEAEAWAEQKARNNHLWAERFALEQIAAVCEVTSERIADLRRRVLCDLPRYLEYRFAVEIIRDFESDYHPDEAPAESPIIAKLKTSAKDRLEELSDSLSYALREDQVRLIADIGDRACYRYGGHRDWVLRRSQVFADGRADYAPHSHLLEIPIRSPYIRYLPRDLVLRCRTQTEARAVLACWGVEVTTERRQVCGEPMTFLMADGWEVACS